MKYFSEWNAIFIKPQIPVNKRMPVFRNILGGYWMIQAKSLEDVIEWAKRVPVDEGDVIEVRRVFEEADFPEEAKKAADNPMVKEEVERHKRSA